MTEFLKSFWAAAQPGLLEVISAVLMLVLTWAARKIGAAYGLTIEERHRSALHMALMSGLQAALMRRDRDAIASAVDHAKASTPDAIRALSASNGVLHGIAQGMYARLPPEAQTMAPPSGKPVWSGSR